MLETLSIKNIAIIDHAEIPFKPGLNILSGETGAGKSIIIESISLILGSRANIDLIRANCEEAVVEGMFDLKETPWIQQRLERLGFHTENSELLIKRVIHRGGRHRIYVNGELATLAILQDLCEGLVDLCGQHEHQSLLKSPTQLDLLDRYGGLTDQTRGFSTQFSHFRSLGRERDALASAESDRSKRADYLKFQIAELKEADLKSNEDDKLHAEKLLLQSAEARIQAAEAVNQAMDAEEEGALNLLRTAAAKLKALTLLDPKSSSILEGMERAIAEVEEVSLSLGRYVRSVDLDQERLEWVQDRLALIADLRRKYGATVSQMITNLRGLEKEFGDLEHNNERLAQIEADLDQSRKDLQKVANKLSQARHKVSELLAKSVTAELKDLKMGDARFLVELADREDLATWTPSGKDAVQFCVQTNKGEPARPLGKIASGGELSRLMLAIRRVIADRGSIGVYLFDEIDAGIGGQTAFQVGKKLKSVSQYNQVICITHLPQVASFADHHLSVRKSTQGSRTQTRILQLSVAERKQELARMLGGPDLTKKSLENAAELLDLAR